MIAIHTLETTLCLLRRDNEILLAMKKRGYGVGNYNGVGGKLESNESPEDAMIRETQEEIFVTPLQYEKVGTIEFIEFYKEKKEKILLHLFVVTNWIGDPKESDEMKPKWFSITGIPYDQMLPDCKFWLPLILEQKKIKASFEFDENTNLLSKQIQEI